MGEEEFKGKYGTLPEVLKCLKETIGEKIPAIMMSAEEELNKSLDLLVAELSNDINIGLDHAVNSLENGEAQLLARNGFFRLSKAPSAEYIAEYPYLKAVKDSAYWHLDPQDAPLFQKRVKEYCQSKLTNILDKCREEATKMLKIHADDFKTKLFAVLTSACGNNFQQISNLTKEDFNVKIPYLSLPEEDYTDNVKATVMRRAWYYLWLFHDEFETGKVNLLSTKALRNQIKTKGQTTLLKLLKSSISNQCIKELDTIKGTISNYFNLRIHAVEKNLNDIQEARKKKGPAEMQKFLRVLPLRVKLEGLMAELEQVNHQIQQGFKLK